MTQPGSFMIQSWRRVAQAALPSCLYLQLQEVTLPGNWEPCTVTCLFWDLGRSVPPPLFPLSLHGLALGKKWGSVLPSCGRGKLQ